LYHHTQAVWTAFVPDYVGPPKAALLKSFLWSLQLGNFMKVLSPPPPIAGFTVKIIVKTLFDFKVCIHGVGWHLKFKGNLDSRL
jgi:hypothetical protein